jgi:hypothetical protein
VHRFHQLFKTKLGLSLVPDTAAVGEAGYGEKEREVIERGGERERMRGEREGDAPARLRRRARERGCAAHARLSGKRVRMRNPKSAYL